MRMTNIIATEFGGHGDKQESAYGGLVNPNKFELSLPARVHNRNVRIFYKDKTLDCFVNDIGPHNIHDDYWTTNSRPLAEKQHGNKAGIDLTPAIHNALGVPGPEGSRTIVIDWEFI